MRRKTHPYIQKSRTHWGWDCGYDKYNDSDEKPSKPLINAQIVEALNSMKQRER